MNFDWKKYKRVFAFGCSFTSYIYPTWADIISYEMPDVEYYNFGRSGMGNLGISSRIAEANTRFKFTDTDLVLVMYTTVYREDRWIGHRWQAHGNVFNQGYYDKNFVKNYVDPVGCLIRDMSFIELSSNYVKSLPCDSLLLKASTLNDECIYMEDTQLMDTVKETYNELWDSFPPSLYETIRTNGWHVTIERSLDGKMFGDTHPTPIEYYEYLKIIGLNLSDSTKEQAEENEQRCRSHTIFNEWGEYFPIVEMRQRQADQLLF